MSVENQIIFSLSIISHGHRDFIVSLLSDLARLNRSDIEVVLTWNIKDEETDFSTEKYPFKLISLVNEKPKGFAANHNAAFRYSSGANFVLLNPDISLPQDPFNPLLDVLQKYSPCIGAPLIKKSNNELEDSARFFPSPLSLAKKAVNKLFNSIPAIEKVPEREDVLNPDWIAGMFIAIPRAIYIQLNGLQERYYLYYEDVDLCARARLNNIEIYVSKNAYAIHHAQRKSHRSVRFFRWHLESAIKFFASKAYIALSLRKIYKRLAT